MKKLLSLLAFLVLPCLGFAQSFSGYIDFQHNQDMTEAASRTSNMPDFLKESIDQAFRAEGPDVLSLQQRLYFTDTWSLRYPHRFKDGKGEEAPVSYDISATLSRVRADSLTIEELGVPLFGANVEEKRAALDSSDVKIRTAASNKEPEGEYIVLDSQVVFLGFNCQLYYNEQAEATLWITQELPTHLSVAFQEIEGKIPEGAVLKLENKARGVLVEATKVSFCPINEPYLRDTPLYEIVPERLLQE